MNQPKHEPVCRDTQPKRWKAALWDLITRHNCATHARLNVFERLLLARLDAIDAQLAAQAIALDKILTAVLLPAAVRGVLAFEGEGIARIEGEHIEMKVAQNKQGILSVTLKNASGGPGRVDGIPTWTPSVEGVVTLTPAVDGMSCGVKTLPVATPDEVKTVVITFAADGDLGDGVTSIVASATLTVYDPSGGAVIAEITVGEFTDSGAPLEP